MTTRAARPSFRPRRAGGFALILTMIILSVLVLVAISYLASMSAERAAADAFANRARAEAAARAGADVAMATLRESFRLFPDSVTAWDVNQSLNSNGTYNEGTSLYLRAQPTTANVPDPDVPNPGTTPQRNVTVPDPSPAPPLDNRPPTLTSAADTRRTFVLPLVSGVGNGRPRLVSERIPTASDTAPFPGTLPMFDLKEADATKPATYETHFTDLNARRSAKDIQGVIGSPPGWATNPLNPDPTAPKPARAPWVELKDSAGLSLARYAFFVEDDSFKAPLNLAGYQDRASADNLNDVGAPSARRSFSPSDLSLAGPLASLGDTTSAKNVFDARAFFPAARFAETRGTAQATGLSGTVADALRYVVSTDSGALNLSRHGSQRLNLNATNTVNRTSPVTMLEIRKLVETMRFHLPSLGQRFYRNTNPDPSPPLSPAARATLLNGTSDVTATHAEIYYYKLAANLRDYLDQDLQPTILVSPPPGSPPNVPVLGPGSVDHALGGDGKGGNGLYVWAQGKESVPFLQEAVVRYRPTVDGVNNTYTLKVDYYLEFWNMSDRDVSARDLGQPFVRVKNQQGWFSASLKPNAVAADEPVINAPLETTDPDGIAPKDDKAAVTLRDFNIDLLNGVTPAGGGNGVIFRAGQATVITTDPDYANVKDSYYLYGSRKLSASGAGVNTANIFYCAGSPTMAAGKRVFKGDVPPPATPGYTRGILPNFRMGRSSSGTALDYEIEVSLGNQRGYLDWAVGPVAISSGRSPERYDFTSATSGVMSNDYVHGGSLFGNSTTVSQLGDPRANNEQLYVTLFNNASSPTQPDQARFATAGSTDDPPYALGLPNARYVRPNGVAPSNVSGSATFIPWPDYWDWASTTYPTTNATALTSPAVIADGALTSIGQLGDLFDPARLKGTVGSLGVEGGRGGGRTLKIGQRDDRYTADSTPNTAPDAIPASNGWAAWRLVDVFGLDDAVRLPARINLNGVPRDDGAALRSALTGFKFQPQTGADPLVHGDRQLAGKDLNADPAVAGGLKELTASLKARLNPPVVTPGTSLTLPRPLFERGELGELGTGVKALFGINSTSGVVKNDELAGVDMNKAFDRGREEIFRRLAEVTCTRGDTFTVHCVGQTLLQTNLTAPKRVTATQRLRLTFRLVPKLANGSAFQPGAKTNADGSFTPTEFNPDDSASVADRFAKPDHYDVQILQATSAPL